MRLKNIKLNSSSSQAACMYAERAWAFFFFSPLKIDCLKAPFIGVLVCKAIRPIIVLQANNPEMNLGTTALSKQREDRKYGNVINIHW